MKHPDYGIIGIIPSYPQVIEQEIPEKKSIKTSFKCLTCEEAISSMGPKEQIYITIYKYSLVHSVV